MWCLLVLLCSQVVAFSAGFTAPHTLKSEEGLHRKQRNPEDLMNVVSCVIFSAYLLNVSFTTPHYHCTISKSLREEA